MYLLSKNKTSFNHVENQTQQGEEETVFSADDIRQFFEDYHKRKQHSMGYLDGDNDESVTTEPDREGAVEDSFAPDKKTEIPTHVRYVTQVCMENTFQITLSQLQRFFSILKSFIPIIEIKVHKTRGIARCFSNLQPVFVTIFVMDFMNRFWTSKFVAKTGF